jgi:hypothetical protein
MALSVGEVMLWGCLLVTATVLTRPVARGVLLPGAFGCFRVVFNDALVPGRRRVRPAAGSVTWQVQAKVVTLAKTTPARA